MDARIRAAGREPSDAPVPGPRLAPRALAAARGEEVLEPARLRHRVSEGKRLQGEAKLLDKRLKYCSDAWWAKDLWLLIFSCCCCCIQCLE